VKQGVKKEILQRLETVYADTTSALRFADPFECLVATILAAQCTDVRVNQVTPALFARYPNPQAMAEATPEDLIPYIHSCGFFNSKARHLVGAAQRICQAHGGAVPDTLEELRTLPGVGQKTANVVYANAFGGDAIAVDTHVFRVSNRLGLAHAKTPEKTEDDLRQAIAQERWSEAHHWILWHGRRVCHARKPACETCFLKDLCKFYLENSSHHLQSKE